MGSLVPRIIVAFVNRHLTARVANWPMQLIGKAINGASYKIFHYSTVTFEQTVLVFFEIDLPILLTAEKTRVVV